MSCFLSVFLMKGFLEKSKAAAEESLYKLLLNMKFVKNVFTSFGNVFNFYWHSLLLVLVYRTGNP